MGADLVAHREANEVMEIIGEGGFATTSCCPAFVSMINKHFPKLAQNISSTVSPMVAMAQYIKQNFPKGKVVFIGPCMAKKSEMLSHKAKGYVDYVLTFEELMAMLDAKGIGFDEGEESERQASAYGLGFAQSGGVAKAVLRIAHEYDWESKIIPKSCNGAAECKKALTIANVGKLTENLIEGMICEGGCIGGPASIIQVNTARRNLGRKVQNNDINNISDNLKKFSLL